MFTDGPQTISLERTAAGQTRAHMPPPEPATKGHLWERRRRGAAEGPVKSAGVCAAYLTSTTAPRYFVPLATDAVGVVSLSAMVWMRDRVQLSKS